MEFYKEGDHSKAICPSCKEVTCTTFRVRDADIKDGSKTFHVPSVLVAVCDKCEKTVAIPQQSYPAVAEVRLKEESSNYEVRSPRHLLDILNIAITHLDIKLTSDLPANLIKYFWARFELDATTIELLRKNLDSDLLQGNFKKPARFSTNLGPSLTDKVDALRAELKFSKTELFDATVVQVKKEILDRPIGDATREIQSALLAYG